MPLNLSGIERFLVGEMIDEIILTRDEEGTEDDIFDPETGQYIKPGGDDQIWYEGKALLMTLNVFPSQREEGGGTSLSIDFQLHIPKNTPAMTLYDHLTVISCVRTPHLVGKLFRIRSLEDNTFSVSQAARIYRWEQRTLQ